MVRLTENRKSFHYVQIDEALCNGCVLCMKVCPTNALHPTWHEAGLEGVWTPLLVARVGWCEYECNLCGQVCPTGAIAELDLPAKKETRIGLSRSARR